MGLAGADKNQVAFARYNRFVMALPSPARVVETRLQHAPCRGKCHKACQQNSEGDFLRSGLESETCGNCSNFQRFSEQCSRQIGWPVTACLRPEAVALPRNVGCRFPALRSAEVASQRCDGIQLRVREVRLWSQQGKPLRDRCHFFHQTSPCQLRLLSILRQ